MRYKVEILVRERVEEHEVCAYPTFECDSIEELHEGVEQAVDEALAAIQKAKEKASV